MARVAIIGIGLIGASVGLKLRRTLPEGTEFVGFDTDPKRAAAARSGAVHRTANGIAETVEGVSIVIVCVPTGAVEDVFQAMSGHLATGTVVTDTAAVKEPVLEWASRHLPRHVDFVGGSPLVYLPGGPQQARAEVFEGHEYAVIPSPTASQQAVETVIGLVESLGARPYFVDAVEHDSLVALGRQVPELISTALLSVQTKSRSKQDLSRFLARPFYDVTRLLVDNIGSRDDVVNEWAANEPRIGNWVDSMIEALADVRELLRNRDIDALRALFESAGEERRALLAVDVPSADTSKLEIPSSAEHMGEMLMGRALMDRQKRLFQAGEQANRKPSPNEQRS